MPWGAAIAAGGAILGGVISSNGQKSAADTQANAARDANQTNLDMYNQTRTDNLPALGARNDALAKLEQLLGVGTPGGDGFGSLGGGINPGDVTKDPGYAFGMQQGQQTLNNSLNARGMRDSGAALKAASRYGTDYATTKYDDAFNRTLQSRNQQLNPLLSLAGAGQVGTSQIGAAGENFANQSGANTIGAGNARAASQIGQANTWANTGNQLAGWYQNQNRGGWGSSVSGGGSMYGGGGSGYNDQNGSDVGWYPG